MVKICTRILKQIFVIKARNLFSSTNNTFKTKKPSSDKYRGSSRIVPNRRRIGYVDVVVLVNVHMCGGVVEKRGCWGVRQGACTVDPEHGTCRAEVCILVQRATILSKSVFFVFIKSPTMH
jgi:hypothetical protein